MLLSDSEDAYFDQKERTKGQSTEYQRTAVCGVEEILWVFQSERILKLEDHDKVTVFIDRIGRDCSVKEVESWIIIGMGLRCKD